jgi:predicted transcriptional regulator
MENNIPSKRILELIALDENLPQLEAVTKALGSSTRLEILRFLGTHTCSVLEIAEALDLPQSTATLHIGILEKAGLIQTDLQPATRGVQKMCARAFDRIVVQLPAEQEKQELAVRVGMPIGAYVDANVISTCGLLSDYKIIGQLDQPSSFFEPERIQAQLIWFRRGYVEYRFPIRKVHLATLENLEVSFEVCSEAPLHHADWPSDITVWINGVELGSWTSPADFGGERGALTPDWWDTNNTQYGLLKVWKVSPQGSFVDGVKISSVRLGDVKIDEAETVSVRIGIKEDARHIGGINLFGSRFGNYPQDILLKLTYKQQP